MCGGGHPLVSALSLFEEGLNLTGATKPNLLVIPTAKTTAANHASISNRMKEYGASRGLDVRIMHEFGGLPSQMEFAEQLEWADAAYLTGGNTELAVRSWVDAEIVTPLAEGVLAGEVVAIGISAGGPWFDWMWSDSDQYSTPKGEPWDYKRVECLGIYDASYCPHVNTRHPVTCVPREESYKAALLEEGAGIGIGIENDTALRIVGKTCKVITSVRGGGLNRYVVRDDHALSISRFGAGDNIMSLPELLTA